MSAREKNMSATKYLHLLAGSSIVQLAILFGSAVGSVAMPTVALASGGQCLWEGGSGAAGGHPECKVEDCMGYGGFAECRDPEPGELPPLTASQLGPDYWIYNMCDEMPAHQSSNARWCTAAGGTWYVSPGWNTSCIDLPPDIVGGGGTSTGSEERAISISDTFANGSACAPALDNDTGWGATLDQWSFCSYGGTNYVGDIEVESKRQRNYARTTCPGGLTISLMRHRAVVCPDGYNQRWSNNKLQCWKPAEDPCLQVSNPVAPFSGSNTRPRSTIARTPERIWNSFGTTAASGAFEPQGSTFPRWRRRAPFSRTTIGVTTTKRASTLSTAIRS